MYSSLSFALKTKPSLMPTHGSIGSAWHYRVHVVYHHTLKLLIVQDLMEPLPPTPHPCCIWMDNLLGWFAHTHTHTVSSTSRRLRPLLMRERVLLAVFSSWAPQGLHSLGREPAFLFHEDLIHGYRHQSTT